MGRLFGTDGIRGIVNQDLTADLAMRVGASLGNILADNGSKCSQKVLLQYPDWSWFQACFQGLRLWSIRQQLYLPF